MLDLLVITPFSIKGGDGNGWVSANSVCVLEEPPVNPNLNNPLRLRLLPR